MSKIYNSLQLSGYQKTSINEIDFDKESLYQLNQFKDKLRVNCNLKL